MAKEAKFCPGCGHPIVLRFLYMILKEKQLESKAVLGLDIGCSLLAWDFLPVNTFQTHHGRVTSTMVGYKRAQPDSLSFAYTGDGGAYAIGMQSLMWAAIRNEPITVIVVNNSNYAMTGGQTAPTSYKGQITDTDPSGVEGEPVFGPELVRQVNKKAYIARTAVNDPKQVKEYLEKAIEAQQAGNFAMVEFLSYCPLNWKTIGVETNNYLNDNLKTLFPIGEF